VDSRRLLNRLRLQARLRIQKPMRLFLGLAIPGAALLASVALDAGRGTDAPLPDTRTAGAQGVALASGAAELHVTFIHTSDEHSAVLPVPLVDHRGEATDPTFGGFARLASAIEVQRSRAAARGEPSLVTSAGDNIGGSPFAWLMLQGLSTELGLMVEMGYDVITLGNHEFDYDSEYLARYIAAAGYPVAAARTALVATNTVAPAGHPLGELGMRRTHLVELPNGLRVGFFGLLGRGAARFATLAPPVQFSDAHAAAAGAVEELRTAGAHVVVAITHSGLREDQELARAVAGIDIILGGHDHLLLETPEVVNGTILVHPGAHTRQLTVLEVAYDVASGRVRVRNGETGTPHVIALDASVPSHAGISARIDAFRAPLEALVRSLTGAHADDGSEAARSAHARLHGAADLLAATIARSDSLLRYGPPMQETPLGNFVTDAMRHAVTNATGEHVDVAFQANGVIRGDLRAGTVPERAGDIAFHDMASVVGMGRGPDGTPGYPLVSVWLTGEEVRRVLEISVLLSELMRNSYYLQVSGVRMRYDPARAILFRIPFRGTPIPTGRAVLHAERETEHGYVPLARREGGLYHVVTDYYVASFLPMVGQMLPSLALVPKDRAGHPIANIDDAVVQRDGRPLATWQAVLEHAVAQPADADGVPRVAPAYAGVAGRLVQTRGMPLWLPPLLLMAALTAGAALLLRRRRRRPVASPDRPR
jgi:5'-nucleotidase / UDP-sugar diphosphatase